MFIKLKKKYFKIFSKKKKKHTFFNFFFNTNFFFSKIIFLNGKYILFIIHLVNFFSFQLSFLLL